MGSRLPSPRTAPCGTTPARRKPTARGRTSVRRTAKTSAPARTRSAGGRKLTARPEGGESITGSVRMGICAWVRIRRIFTSRIGGTAFWGADKWLCENGETCVEKDKKYIYEQNWGDCKS